MKYERPEYEFPIRGVRWTGGVAQPAGIYWLDGDWTIAAHGSPAEAALLDRGAMEIATLRFDQDRLERTHTAGRVQRVPAVGLIEDATSDRSEPVAAGRRTETGTQQRACHDSTGDPDRG